MLEKIEDGRRRGRQRMRWLDGITDSVDSMNLSKLWEKAEDKEPEVQGVTKARLDLATEQQQLNLPINYIRINQMKAFKRLFIKSLIFLERTDAEA